MRGLACLLPIVLSGLCLAQVRPTTASRVVKHFSFEERETNPGDVPRYWFRGQTDPAQSRTRPGFPEWNKARLQYVQEGGIAATGSGAVELPTQGGSTSLILESGVVPVFRQADYGVTAKFRTSGLSHAGARITARFLNARGEPLSGTEVSSEILQASEWRDIGLELDGDRDGVAYVQIELTLLQPEHWGRPPEPRAVFSQDVEGSAWFDDVIIMQLPGVQFKTSVPLNVATDAEPPELITSVRDLTGEDLSIAIDVVDIDDAVVDSFESQLGGGAIETRWRPKLRSFGWYQARLRILSPSGQVGGSVTDFVWIPRSSAASRELSSETMKDRARFGLIMRSLPPESGEQLALMLKSIGLGRVTVPLWSDLGESTIPDAFMPIADQLLASGLDVAFSLGRVPRELSQLTKVPLDDPWSLMLLDSATWMPQLGAIFDRYGQRVRRWQIGSIGDDRSFWRSNAAGDFAALERILSKLVSGPQICLPTRLDREWNLEALQGRHGPGMLIALVSPETTDLGAGEGVRNLHAQSLKDAQPVDLAVTFPMLPQSVFGRRAPPAEMVKRAVECWAATSGNAGGETALSLVEPWGFSPGAHPQILPRPELAAWANLLKRLDNRRVLGSYSIAEGVACYILGPVEGTSSERGGALVAWNRSAPLELAVLEGFLGEQGIQIIDLYGNQLVPPAGDVTAGERTSVRIPIGNEPIFVEGVNPELCRFLSRFRLDNPFLASTNNQHERLLIMENPWPVAVSGKLTILEPGGVDGARGQRERTWRIAPRTMSFTIEPRGSISEPLGIAFSSTEEQGQKPFVVSVELLADKSYGPLTIRRLLNIGLDTASMELSYSIRGDRGQDLTVEAAIANTGTETLLMELTCFAPGLPRMKMVVSDLVPGQQSIKRFLFSGEAAKLRGQRIIVSAVSLEGGTRLNRSIVIE